ncbi:hypothetical protein JW905_15825, partial [bacterium]|nr:hypothetical protein [candidate division CSSED10-310 bacterium]
WKDLTITYTTGDIVSGDLLIYIGCTGCYSHPVYVDNVRLTATPVAQPVDENRSFETGDFAGWVAHSSGGWNASMSVLSDASPWGGVLPDGTHYAKIVSGGDQNNLLSYLYQDVGALEANTTYTLTIAFGSNNQFRPYGSFALLNGTDQTGTVLESMSITSAFTDWVNAWHDLSITYTTGDTVSGDLVLYIGVTGSYNRAVYVDNIRLAAAPVEQPILQNLSFETGDFSGWTTHSSGGWNASMSVLSDASPWGGVLPDGTRYAKIVSGGDTNGLLSYLYQSAGALLPNTTYTLTVAVGSNNQFRPDGSIALINGIDQTGTVLATTSVSTPFTDWVNAWYDITVTFTTADTVSGDLLIYIGCTGCYSHPMYIDNVRLTATPAA